MFNFHSEAQHHCYYLGFKYIEVGRWFFQTCHAFKCESILFVCSLVEVFAAAAFSLLPAHSPGLFFISYLWWNSEVVSESNTLQGCGFYLLSSSVHLSRLRIGVLDQDIGNWCCDGVRILWVGCGVSTIVSYGFVGEKFSNCWKTWRQT